VHAMSEEGPVREAQGEVATVGVVVATPMRGVVPPTRHECPAHASWWSEKWNNYIQFLYLGTFYNCTMFVGN
jgi:hypothetical protein